jgi:phage replication-related protein YjqB (UPF0714/DUF867 family)
VRRRAHSVAHCTADPPRHGSFDRWHITSTDIHEASFPRLNSVLSRGFTYAVAFHGFDDPEILIDILIGGAAPYSLKQEIETAIKGAIAGSDITVRIASPDEKFGGDSLDNIVNRLTAGRANGNPDRAELPGPREPLAGDRQRGCQRLQHQARMNISRSRCGGEG